MGESETEKPRGWLRSLPTEKLSAESTVSIVRPLIVRDEDYAMLNKVLNKEKLRLYRKAAEDYADKNKLYGEYTNNSNCLVIQYDKKGTKRTKGGLEEILHNGRPTAADIESTAVIPQIIEKGIYLESDDNRKKEEKPSIVRYHYYICGLQIGDNNYVVAFNVAEQRDRKNRYYFHQLVLQKQSGFDNEPARYASSPEVSSAIINSGVSNSELTNRGETPSSTPVSNSKGNDNSEISKGNE